VSGKARFQAVRLPGCPAWQNSRGGQTEGFGCA
jgi:hypothetical protein